MVHRNAAKVAGYGVSLAYVGKMPDTRDKLL